MRRFIIAAFCAVACTLGFAQIAQTAMAASVGQHLCEASGSNCVSSNTTSGGSKVVEVPPYGREFQFVPTGGCWPDPFDGRCETVGYLNFYGLGGNVCADLSQSDDFTFVVGPCSGVNGVNYAQYDYGNGIHGYINQQATRINGMEPMMFSGFNIDNHAIQSWCAVWFCSESGPYQRWDFVNNAAGAGTQAASAKAAKAADQPPECHTAELVAPSGKIAWVVACGSGPSRESPWQDWMALAVHKPLIMDGVRSITPANCPKASPCVLIAANSPAS